MKELKKLRLWWLPADLGIAWGAGLDECRERYPDLIVSESETQLALRLRGGTRAIDALVSLFNEAQRLERLQEMLAISRDFWDGVEPEEFRSVQMEYESIFRDRLAECQSVLGRPDFLGRWDSPGFPDGEWAELIAIREPNECRIQLELERQDQEVPFIVRITTLARESGFVVKPLGLPY